MFMNESVWLMRNKCGNMLCEMAAPIFIVLFPSKTVYIWWKWSNFFSNIFMFSGVRSMIFYFSFSRQVPFSYICGYIYMCVDIFKDCYSLYSEIHPKVIQIVQVKSDVPYHFSCWCTRCFGVRMICSCNIMK